jgi:hypothetical protein
MRISLVGIGVMLALLAGCSDETGAPKDQGTVADRGSPREAGGGDGTAVDFAAACRTLVTTCSASTYWTGYLSPFTVDSCTAVFRCVSKLYTPACATKFAGLVSCLLTFGTAADCETKCVSHQSEVGSSCPCPASCGVKCPGDSGV